MKQSGNSLALNRERVPGYRNAPQFIAAEFNNELIVLYHIHTCTICWYNAYTSVGSTKSHFN